MRNMTFTGIDASLEISLLEYGLIVSKEEYEGTHLCIFKTAYGGFGTAYITHKEIDNLINGNDWIEPKEVSKFLSFAGVNKEVFLNQPLECKLHSLISYYGTDNILGTDYYPMTEQIAIQRYLNKD
jgi:hypothetical protein